MAKVPPQDEAAPNAALEEFSAMRHFSMQVLGLTEALHLDNPGTILLRAKVITWQKDS